MTKLVARGFLFSWAGIVGGFGCATEAPREVTTAECPAALVSAQGLTAQGLSVQGITLQGVSVQGMQSQGMQAQGVQVQGLTAQGMQANGMQGQGLQAQGISAQGISPQGVSYQGVIGDGGLRGVALRHVTSDEATRWVEGTGPNLDPDQLVFIGVNEGVLSGRTARGVALAESELPGLLLPFISLQGTPLWITVAAVSRHPDASDLPLYALAIDGESLCADPAGGMFVPGIWDETGARHDSVTTAGQSVDTTFACTAGVITKCVAWGYRPWSVGADIHAACTRMARADYCGNGVPHTQNGTLIDLYDTRGIQTPVADDGMSFEAAWGVDGALCVRETRYIDLSSSGERIFPSCWNELPRCETFEEALSLGAELGNNSNHETRVFDCSR